jgi:prepilin-type N-terminal cleavage/methylation domain-containing protein
MLIVSNFSLRFKGFTLAELLISLAILSIIATFTIPKILVTQQGQKYNSSAKETFSMVSGAYQNLLLNSTASSGTSAIDLSPYMNYISVDSTSIIDNVNTGTTTSCDSSNGLCLNLHNGGKLLLLKYTFNGTSPTNALFFQFDPDGVVTDGTTNGPGKSVKFAVYYNGMLTSRNNFLTGTQNSSGTYNPTTSNDPSWFSW